MSATAQPIDLPGTDTRAGARSNLRVALWIGASVLASGLAAGFFAVNDYAAETAASVAVSQRNAGRFEAVYVESAETKLAALRLGVDLALANPDIVGAFARDDRPGLAKVAVPLFTETLKPKYGLTQFNFWTPPAKLYLRANDPKEFGTDGSGVRRTIVATSERRAAVSGMETALGGRLTIRATAPVLDGTRLVGVVEIGDDLVSILRRARASTGVEFAAGLDRKRSDDVERIPNKTDDAVQGTDVFFEYSSDAAARLTRAIAFNPRDTAGQLVHADGRSVYVKPFAISNFSGVPTVVVATLSDLTQPFAEARRSSAIKGGILFLVLSVAATLGLLQFRKLQAGFSRIVFGERRKLQEATRELDVLRSRLKHVDVAKLGYFNNLVAAVTEPLRAISGQLGSVLPQIADGLRAAPDGPGRRDVAERDGASADRGAGQGTGQGTGHGIGRADLVERLDFALAEIGRLTRMMVDFRQIEMTRQNLVRQPTGTVRLADAVGAALDGELARFRRLPGLTITADVPASLPLVRGSQELLRSTIAGLAGYAAQKGGHGTIRLAGALDEGGWVRLSVAGSAFATAGPPTEALLDATRQFMDQLSGGGPIAEENAVMMALALARTIVETAGGRIDVLAGDAGPGFVLHLPAAV